MPDSEYKVEEYNWLIASEWADSLGADIITSSLGYTEFDDPAMNYTFADMDGQTAVATRAAVWATERGILVVTSSGNSRTGAWRYIGTPADADNILSVGAIDATGNLAPFSSGGPTADGRLKPEVVAMGVNTVVVDAAGDYRFGNGTSYAAPQIAGFAAGVWQAYPELSNLELRDVIIRSSNQYTSPDNDYGYGLPNFRLLHTGVLGLDDEKGKDIVQLYPNPVQQHQQLIIQYSLSLSASQSLIVQVVDAAGRQLLRQHLSPNQHDRYELDVAGLKAGMYYLKLITDKGNSVHKFLRQ